MSAITLERAVTPEGTVVVLVLDVPGEPVNTLGRPVADELAAALELARADATVAGVVLISGKADNFIAGADIREFTQVRTAAEAEALSRFGQEMIAAVEAFPKPVVVAIHGACLGGGCELALGCHWRVASDHPKTQIGLPEVQLGLIPGAGGCNRLPRLVGVRAALDIILAGKGERAAKALKVGLVDELVPRPILRETAVRAALRLAREGLPKRGAAGAGLAGAVLDRTGPGRRLVYRQAAAQVRRKTGGHYPAPLAALETVRVSLEQGLEAGYALERRTFGELAVGEVSRRLVEIFFASTALKKDDGVADPPADVPPVRTLGVVGAGFMGAGIAGTAALQARIPVRLRDTELARVGRGLRAAQGLLDERLRRRRLGRPEHARLVQLLSGGADLAGLAGADLVIEAVFEDLAVKRAVLAEVQGAAPPRAVFASNTSTIPIGRIAEGAPRPGRVLGMHFFSPVEKMPLLEVIPHAGTEPDAIVQAVRFGRALGKTVIVVADAPGFWVNRILTPYLNEAGLLLEEGAPIDLLDQVMTRYGFPVGPVTLLDEVGLDVGLKGGAVMHQAIGARLEPSGVVAKMVADGRLGRKNGRGFFTYADGKKEGVDASVYALLGVQPKPGTNAAMAEERLVMAMLNEAAHALGEGVVRSARDGDLGAVFGIGFPPFRGGPLRALDAIGAARAVETLQRLQAEHGARFAPAPALVAAAHDGRPLRD
ncbi:MAG: 3-hydroxyacyl-CoA dehydrogenase NAD-binding domain-containing protein [Gemmatimonadales bacterium]|nr:3-hydroxyacyl-CoA dehydrogenase NAD-binding domain-containing protein [Gemmatimonadales bacterium]